MKHLSIFALMFAILNSVSSHATPGYAAAAIADKGRPDADRKLDKDRKPQEMVEFAEIKPGSLVMDVVPGGGYFTRIFAKVVGDKGRVFAYYPSETDAMFKKYFPGVDVMKHFSAYPNVSVLHAPINSLSAPEPLDVVWISQNYHDLHDTFFKPADVSVINKAIFSALKPGGLFIVLDHSAKAGTGLSATESLHRIEESLLKKEVLAAGFKLIDESKVLRNPKDKRDKSVFDPSIRHRTDQFILKFMKPIK